ncbi:MAG: acyltransferase family protein [Hyphomonadaceae bacterium]
MDLRGSSDTRRIQGTRQIDFPRSNNLQWLRLMFAAQVAVVHAGAHLGVPIPSYVQHFPGVPAFFFVSGFLIYASYQNAPGTRYVENRFLRLFPALLFVTLAGGAVAIVAHGWKDLFEHPVTYLVWFLAQVSVGQAYNPELFRDVGVGVINGSLWTITTEIIFYLFVPAIVWLERRVKHAVFMLVVASFSIYALGPLLWSTPIYRDKTIYDAIEVTPLAWGWMFGFGILTVKYFDWLARVIKFLPWAILPVIVMALYGEGLLFGSTGNRLGLVYFACYAMLILWIAFGTASISLATDLSYGIYIWHMPVINLLLVLAIPSPFPVALGLTLVMAATSWFLVEKPALSLKRRSLLPVQTKRKSSSG